MMHQIRFCIDIRLGTACGLEGLPLTFMISISFARALTNSNTSSQVTSTSSISSHLISLSYETLGIVSELIDSPPSDSDSEVRCLDLGHGRSHKSGNPLPRYMPCISPTANASISSSTIVHCPVVAWSYIDPLPEQNLISPAAYLGSSTLTGR